MENINPIITKTGKVKQRKNPIGRFFKMVFAHNFGLKVLAIFTSVALWALAVIL